MPCGKKYPVDFRARRLAEYLEPPERPVMGPDDEAREMLVALIRASGNVPMRIITPSAVSARLKKLVNAPVNADGKTLILRCTPDPKNGDVFTVEEK